MNRRDFLRLAPALSVLPLIGRWLDSSNMPYVSVATGPAPLPWVELNEDGLTINYAAGGTSTLAKDCWLDADGNLIVERWNGEITTKRVSRDNEIFTIQTYRWNAAGEWEEII